MAEQTGEEHRHRVEFDRVGQGVQRLVGQVGKRRDEIEVPVDPHRPDCNALAPMWWRLVAAGREFRLHAIPPALLDFGLVAHRRVFVERATPRQDGFGSSGDLRG